MVADKKKYTIRHIAYSAHKRLGKACELAEKNLADDIIEISKLRNYMESELLQKIPNSKSLGDVKNRISGSINLYVPNIYTDDFFVNLQGVAISSGSACASAGKKPQMFYKQ